MPRQDRAYALGAGRADARHWRQGLWPARWPATVIRMCPGPRPGWARGDLRLSGRSRAGSRGRPGLGRWPLRLLGRLAGVVQGGLDLGDVTPVSGQIASLQRALGLVVEALGLLQEFQHVGVHFAGPGAIAGG